MENLDSTRTILSLMELYGGGLHLILGGNVNLQDENVILYIGYNLKIKACTGKFFGNAVALLAPFMKPIPFLIRQYTTYYIYFIYTKYYCTLFIYCIHKHCLKLYM